MNDMPPELLARLLVISAPPNAIHWWPPAPGWWMLAALGALAIAAAFWLARRHLRRRYRRLAAAQLARVCGDWRGHGDDLRLLLQINLLLRRVAAHCHGRAATAASGAPWVQFLAAQWRGPPPAVADALARGCYQPRLQTDMDAVAAWAADWIRGHSEPRANAPGWLRLRDRMAASHSMTESPGTAASQGAAARRRADV